MARTGKKRALWQRALSLLMALSLCLPAPARAADKVQVTPYTSPVNGGRDYLVVLGSDNTLAVSSGCPEELAAALKRQKNVTQFDQFRDRVGLLYADGSVALFTPGGETAFTPRGRVEQIAVGGTFVAALLKDGTVELLQVSEGLYEDQLLRAEQWQGVETLSAGRGHLLAVTGGKVLAAGANEFGQRSISGETGVVAVSAAYNHSIALRRDGTLVSAGDNTFGQCEVGSLRQIIYVATGMKNTVAVDSAGNVHLLGEESAGMEAAAASPLPSSRQA